MKKVLLLIIPFIICGCQKNEIKNNTMEDCNKNLIELIDDNKFDQIISRSGNITKTNYSEKRIEKLVKDLQNSKYRDVYDLAEDYCIEFIDRFNTTMIDKKGEKIEHKNYYVRILGEQTSVVIYFAIEDYATPNYLNIPKSVQSTDFLIHFYTNDYIDYRREKKSSLNLSDYKNLEAKKAPLNEVEEKDPKGDYSPLHEVEYDITPKRSFHLSSDGYYVNIYYKLSDNEYIIDYIESKKVISDITKNIWLINAR